VVQLIVSAAQFTACKGVLEPIVSACMHLQALVSDGYLLEQAAALWLSEEVPDGRDGVQFPQQDFEDAQFATWANLEVAAAVVQQMSTGTP
jgi:hypothetical protein